MIILYIVLYYFKDYVIQNKLYNYAELSLRLN